MKVFVQSRTWSQGYRWVFVHLDGVNQIIGSLTPHPEYLDLVEYIDPDSQSLILAVLSSGEFAVVVKGVNSDCLLRGKENVKNSFFFLFPASKANYAQALLVVLLSQTEKQNSRKDDIFNHEFISEINNCINEVEGSFIVKAEIYNVIDNFLQSELNKDMSEIKEEVDTVLLAKSSHSRRIDLINHLRCYNFNRQTERKGAVPLVIITGISSGEMAIKAGAMRVLTDKINNEEWINLDPRKAANNHKRDRAKESNLDGITNKNLIHLVFKKIKNIIGFFITSRKSE